MTTEEQTVAEANDYFETVLELAEFVDPSRGAIRACVRLECVFQEERLNLEAAGDN